MAGPGVGVGTGVGVGSLAGSTVATAWPLDKKYAAPKPPTDAIANSATAAMIHGRTASQRFCGGDDIRGAG